jgi:hypothetical protein
MLFRVTTSQNAETDRTGLQMLDTFVSADDLTMRRQNRRHLNQILLSNTCIAKCILKGFEFKFMPSDTLGQKHPLGNQVVDHFNFSYTAITSVFNIPQLVEKDAGL